MPHSPPALLVIALRYAAIILAIQFLGQPWLFAFVADKNAPIINEFAGVLVLLIWNGTLLLFCLAGSRLIGENNPQISRTYQLLAFLNLVVISVCLLFGLVLR